MTTNTNNNNVPANNARMNFSHANCTHDNTKNARAKCRRDMRALFAYDDMRTHARETQYDAHALITNARANVAINDDDTHVDVNQLTFDDVDANAS